MTEIFDFRREPTGEAYRRLLELALSYCDTFRLFVVNEHNLSAQAAAILRDLERHTRTTIREERYPEYPQPVSSPVNSHLFWLNQDSINILATAADRPSAWQLPERPEDLQLLRPDGASWFVSIAHDGYSFLHLKAEEQSAVFRALAEFGPFVPRTIVNHLYPGPTCNVIPKIFHVIDIKSPDVETYKLAAKSSGFHVFEVDLSGAVDEMDTFRAFQKPMAFPLPHNPDWTSLQSYLQDLSWIAGKWYACFINNADQLLGNSPDAFASLIEITGQVSNEWWESRVPFHFFLIGDQLLRPFDYGWLSDQVCFHGANPA